MATSSGISVLPPRAEAEGEALERLLSSLEWHLVDIRRLRTPDEQRLVLETGHATLVYVVDGSVLVPAATLTCDLAVSSAFSAGPAPLPSGGTLLSLGRSRVRVRATAGAALVIARLRPAPGAEHTLAVVPDVLSVNGFARIEPAAAALAGHLGVPADARDGEAAAPAAGTPVLCRLMATTLVLATLRAWAVGGCAPSGWPARSADPFLARVLDAIHAEPGRDWTVEQLAALGAMSRSVFAARFRAAVGASPLEYLTGVRMEAAKALLAEEGATVSAASRLLGYASDEGFSRAFRRHTGMTPSAWRAGARTPARLTA